MTVAVGASGAKVGVDSTTVAIGGRVADCGCSGTAVTNVGVTSSVGGITVSVGEACGTGVKVGRAARVCKSCAFCVATRSGVLVAVAGRGLGVSEGRGVGPSPRIVGPGVINPRLSGYVTNLAVSRVCGTRADGRLTVQ